MNTQLKKEKKKPLKRILMIKMALSISILIIVESFIHIFLLQNVIKFKNIFS